MFELMKQSDSNLSLRVSVLEIYNEQLTDLLRETSTTPDQSTITSSFAGGGGAASNTKLTIVEVSKKLAFFKN